MQVRRVGIIVVVRLAAEVLYGDAIAAAVAVGLGVERLVEIADKMNDEAERVGAFDAGLGFVLEDGELLGDRGEDATAGAAEVLRIACFLAERDINEVP